MSIAGTPQAAAVRYLTDADGPIDDKMVLEMDFTDAEMLNAVASSDWGSQVLESLRAYFASGDWLPEPVEPVLIELQTGEDGGPVLVAVYDHSGYPFRVGYRRPLDRMPFALVCSGTPAQSMAESIARYEIAEPIAPASGEFVVDSNGIHWWSWPPL